MTYSSCHPTRKCHAKGLCKSCYNRSIIRRNERSRLLDNSYSRKWRGKNPGYFVYSKARELKRKYGISLEEFQDKLVAQGNACALCEKPNPTDTDHDHATGRFRGILCHTCNTNLGHYEKIIKRPGLARYLNPI